VSEQVVIPDGIEPVVGWKTFNLVKSTLGQPQPAKKSLLVSPSLGMIWPPEQRSEARCNESTWRYVWSFDIDPAEEIILSDRSDQTGATGPQGIGPTGATGVTVARAVSMTAVMGSLGSLGYHYQMQVPEKPRTVLPGGKRWQLTTEQVPHEIPNESCNCGIHIANDPLAAISYGEILVKVAGWGRVIEGQYGWRCQYAYPLEIYVDSTKQAGTIADYGAPVIVREEAEDPDVAQLADFQRATETALGKPWPRAAFTFLTTAAIGLTAFNVVLNMINPNPMSTALVGIGAFGAAFAFASRLFGKW
jgi:hypothetical protein